MCVEGGFSQIRSHIRYSGLFLKVFIFGYFEEALFCENKFPGPTVIRKYILTNACLDSRDYIIFAARMRFVALSIFQAVARSKRPGIRNTPSASNKATNEAVKLCMVAARRFKTTERAS